MRNICKYYVLINEVVLQEKLLLEKRATMKQFEYSSLGSELKKQTGIAKDFYKLFKDQINVNDIKT